MNTPYDTSPSLLRENGGRIEQSVPEERAGPIYKRILVGTDFSAASAAAFEEGLKLARQNRAELVVAHAAVAPGCVSFMPPEAYGEWETQFRSAARDSIRPLIQEARQKGVKAHKLVIEGLADEALVETAKRLHVDLIVIGTHGRRGVSRLFMGSVASHVVSRAPCAVLTVRCPRKPE